MSYMKTHGKTGEGEKSWKERRGVNSKEEGRVGGSQFSVSDSFLEIIARFLSLSLSPLSSCDSCLIRNVVSSGKRLPCLAALLPRSSALGVCFHFQTHPGCMQGRNLFVLSQFSNAEHLLCQYLYLSQDWLKVYPRFSLRRMRRIFSLAIDERSIPYFPIPFSGYW